MRSWAETPIETIIDAAWLDMIGVRRAWRRRGIATAVLDGRHVPSINANLTAGIDLTLARRLPENLGIAFQGPVKVGAFDIAPDLAYPMLDAHNPDGRSNRDVIRPWINGLDITRRPRRMSIIDFGTDTTREEAALYQVQGRPG